MGTLKLLVHLSLFITLLIAPSWLLIAFWYRKQISQPILIWKRPELVIVTIVFSVFALVLFVIGISSFFSYGGYLQTQEIQKIPPNVFLYSGILSVLWLGILSFLYAALRMLLVQVITEQGIIVNHSFSRIPNLKNVIEWHEISDYYLISDYPNVIFNLITQRKQTNLSRTLLRVPVYLKENFEQLIESRIYSASATRARLQMTRHRYSEN